MNLVGNKPKKMVVSAAALFFMAAVVMFFLISLGQPPAGAADREALQPRSLAPQAAGLAPAAQLPPTAGQVQDPGSSGFAVKHDISPVLRDIPVPPDSPPTTVHEMKEPVENESMGQAAAARPQISDPVLQNNSIRLPSQTNALVSGTNFEGISNLDNVYPPDPNGDVGPNHYVQMVNAHFAIYSKTGTLLYGPAAANTLWAGFGGTCQSSNDGDPIVLYDKIADRWILSQFVATSPYGECIAVSTGPDPTGSYYRYFFQFSTSVFYDYPKLGIWPDGYYLSANRFTATFQGSSAIALDRSAMLTGAAAAFQQFNTSIAYGVLLPSSLDGSTLPPAGSPNYFVEVGTTSLHLWKFHVDWLTPGNSTFTGPTTLPVAAYNELCPTTSSCIPQPGTGVGLDGLGDRLMQRLAYRNLGGYESLVVTHAVNAVSSGIRAGVRWYEIRDPNGAVSIYQQGTYSPDTNNRWLGSAAMDKLGNIAMGYSVSSSAVYPSIRYTGRLVSDPLGTMTEAETILIAGTGSQTGTGFRWGDYANMAVDPVDDCTFWFTSEYLATTGTAPWKTRIGSFRFASCTAGQPTATFTPTATNTFTPTNTNTATPTNTFTPTATYTPTPTNTYTPTATNTATPTNTFTPTFTATPTLASLPKAWTIYLPITMK